MPTGQAFFLWNEMNTSRSNPPLQCKALEKASIIQGDWGCPACPLCWQNTQTPGCMSEKPDVHKPFSGELSFPLSPLLSAKQSKANVQSYVLDSGHLKSLGQTGSPRNLNR